MNRYFYIDISGKQKGTFSPEELRDESIKRDTLVWTNGMTDWKPASEVEDLASLFAESVGYYPPQVPPAPVAPVFNQEEPKKEEEPKKVEVEPMPKTWLVESILITILPIVFCGNILSLIGIAAFVYSMKVEPQYRAGEYSLAKESSREAGRWTKITFWVTIGWIALLVVAIILMLVLGVSLSGIMGGFADSSAFSI